MPTGEGGRSGRGLSLYDLSFDAGTLQIANVGDHVPRMLDARISQRVAPVFERFLVGDFGPPLEVARRDDAEEEKSALPSVRPSFRTVALGGPRTDHDSFGRAARCKEDWEQEGDHHHRLRNGHSSPVTRL